MSSAVLRIQVATLADVPDGQGRIDGVPNELVTVRSIGTGLTHELRFWDVFNPDIAGADVYNPEVPTINAASDGRSWTFTPPGGTDGYGQTFGIELVVDRGLATQARARRIYAIPTRDFQLTYPLFAEGADPQASLFNNGTAQVANSADNHDGNWRGYHPRLLEWIRAVEAPILRTFLVEPDPSRYQEALSFGLAAATTDEVHVGTVFLPVCTIVQVTADWGQQTDGAATARMRLKRQTGGATVMEIDRTALRAKAVHVRADEIANEDAYELFMMSTTAAKNWINKRTEIQIRVG